MELAMRRALMCVNCLSWAAFGLSGCAGNQSSDSRSAYDWESEYGAADEEEDADEVAQDAWSAYRESDTTEPPQVVDDKVADNAWKQYDAASEGTCRVEDFAYTATVQGNRSEVMSFVAVLSGTDVEMGPWTIGRITDSKAVAKMPFEQEFSAISGNVTQLEAPPWTKYTAYGCTDTQTYLGAIQLAYIGHASNVVPK